MLQPAVTVTIVHEIPGRIRLHVQKDFALKYWEKISKNIISLEEFAKVRMNNIINTVLLEYDGDLYEREEILTRFSLILVKISGLRPVRIIFEKEKKELSDVAFYSGILLLSALLGPILTKDKNIHRKLNVFASLGTAGAVIEHGYEEVKHQGHFDPEALSLVYLISSVGTDKLLPAAIFTWGTTFARHLVQLRQEIGVEFRPVPTNMSINGEAGFELKFIPLYGTEDKMTLLKIIPSLVFNAISGAVTEKKSSSLVEDLRLFNEGHKNIIENVRKIYIEKEL